MKRTLKRGSKVREIAKREAIGLCMVGGRNLVSWWYKGACRGLVYIGSCTFHEAAVGAVLSFVDGQHRFARVGSKRAGEWKAVCGWLNALVDRESGRPRRAIKVARQSGCLKAGL